MYVNFLSVDDTERNTFCKPFLGSTGFSYHEDDEPSEYFSNFRIIHKEKRITERTSTGKSSVKADIDYIAKKFTSQKKV